MSVHRAQLLLFALAALGGCGQSQMADVPARTVSGASSMSAVVQRFAQANKIKHVVIVIQENRSFDNLFEGFVGADTASSGLNSKGQTIALQPVSLNAKYEINHFVSDFLLACDGGPSGQSCKMDGFDQEFAYGNGVPPNPQYAYVRHDETQPYFDLAGQYVLADRMFASNIDASFVSHQYIIAGQAGDSANIPDLKWGCGGGKRDLVDTLASDRTIGPQESPCFDYTTIADELAAKGLSWRSYAMAEPNGNAGWNGYMAIKHIVQGPDWAKAVRSPPGRFLRDVANGRLASVTWVAPTGHASDHPDPAGGGKQGPQWVTNVVNAVGQSKFWNSSAIFVMWDEWGGWYDHVPPRYVDFDGLGFRVPLIVISPYAKKGYVSHVEYEHGSILKFIEDTFGLGRLAASDTRANSPAPDCFDFAQQPRPFAPFRTTMSAKDFIDAPPDYSPVDMDSVR